VPTVLYSAAVVCPMDGPPLADAGVLVAADRVVEVGPVARLRSDADRSHHLDGVLLPGLVDGASRFEWSDLGAQPADAGAQPETVDEPTAGWTDDRWQRSARRGVQESVRAGVTCAGDTVARGTGVPAACRAGLRGTSRIELHEVDDRHAPEVLDAVDASLGLPAPGRRLGVAVRSPASVSSSVLAGLADLARRRDAPLHVPCARTRAEVEALRRGTGPLALVARRRARAYDWLGAGFDETPVQVLRRCGALAAGTTLAHGVWVTPDDAGRIAGAGAAVVCTPRCDEAAGDGAAPLELYAEAGVTLALGTGGVPCADADVLTDAAAWVRLARRRGLGGWPAADGVRSLEHQALRLATIDGAVALGAGDDSGVIAPGRRADLVGVAVQTTPRDVYRALVTEGRGRQVLTVLAGVARARRPGAHAPWVPVDRRVADELERSP
jgi:aminodeoxyfutalosine deaminase